MKLYSIKDLASILSIHPETLRVWIREERIKAVKVGREWRVTQDQLDELLKGDK